MWKKKAIISLGRNGNINNSGLVFLTRRSNGSKGGQSKWVKYQHLITIIFSTLFTLIVYTLFFLLDKKSNDRKTKPYNKTKVQGRAFDLYLLLSEFFLYIYTIHRCVFFKTKNETTLKINTATRAKSSLISTLLTLLLQC